MENPLTLKPLKKKDGAGRLLTTLGMGLVLKAGIPPGRVSFGSQCPPGQFSLENEHFSALGAFGITRGGVTPGKG